MSKSAVQIVRCERSDKPEYQITLYISYELQDSVFNYTARQHERARVCFVASEIALLSGGAGVSSCWLASPRVPPSAMARAGLDGEGDVLPHHPPRRFRDSEKNQ
ncbi:hypothetical protein ACJJTC_006526 [Scirpophaga incertulas]